MISKVAINNFQSHQETEIDMSEGVTAFSGNSDCGKSAVLRSILWCITNSPSGDSFVSDWAKDAKGKIKFPCSVSIDTNGIRVTRTRSKDFNGYVVGYGDHEEKFEALRTDVPQQVYEAFNLDKVNIQRQLDGLFMLSATPGENARYINELVKLDEIDKVSSALVSIKRDTCSRQNFVKETIEMLRKELDKYENLDELTDKVKRLNELNSEILKIQETNDELSEEIDTYDRVSTFVHRKSSIIHDAVYSLDKLRNVSEQIDRLIPIVNMGTDIELYKEKKAFVAELSDIVDGVSIARIGELEEYISRTEKENDALKEEIDEYDGLTELTTELPIEINELVGKLNTMACPMCGRVGCKH